MRRISTGIAELDLVLQGGLMPGSLAVLAGAPGSGKTILAQQICFANAHPDAKAIYYTTLSEPHSKLVDHLDGFSFFDPGAIGKSVEFRHLASLATGDNVTMADVTTEVVRQAFEQRPSVIVIDSSKALHEAEGPGFRKSIYDLASRVAHTDALLLLVGEYELEDIKTAAEFAVADAILYMANDGSGKTDHRWLRVSKLRGSDYLGGRHTFRIGQSGISVYPRPESTLAPPHGESEGRISSGFPGLDEMMKGGVPTGSVTIVAGPSGAGKTVIGLQFLTEGLARGETCLYVSFQESERQLLDKARHFGWGLADAAASGALMVTHVQPVELGLDVVAAEIRRAAVDSGAKRVVIDSIAELEHSADRDRFSDYLWALVGSLRHGGATTILTSETSAFFGPAFELAHGLSYVADNVVLLRYTELESEIHRALVVVKMRESDHVKSLVEFEITPQGAKVLGKFAGVSGVLSGNPTPTEQRFKEFFGK
jgi:circadian clock protein KaiC